MAVEIQKGTHYGVSANYFRIISLTIDRPLLKIKIVVGGYASKFAHDSRQTELVKIVYDLEGEHLEPYMTNLETSKITIAQLYEMLYEMTVNVDPFFEGAVRV